MMTPKFRAWDKKSKLMAKVISLSFYENESPYKGSDMESFIYYEDLDITSLRPFDQIELMQFTGLKDKNGVEIYEGDIVKITIDNGFDYLEDAPSIVKSSDRHSGLICKVLSNDLEYRIFADESTGCEYKVIGNIYENPGLLEEKDDK